jgi:hypothetical protein
MSWSLAIDRFGATVARVLTFFFLPRLEHQRLAAGRPSRLHLCKEGRTRKVENGFAH